MTEYAVGSRLPPAAVQRGESSGASGFVALGLGVAALGVALWLAPSAGIGMTSPGHAAPAAGMTLRVSAFVALAVAAFAGALTLRPRYGGLAPWWVALCLFGTATWAMVLWQPLPILALAAVVMGFVVVLFERLPSRRRLASATEAGTEASAEAAQPLMYQGDAPEVARRVVPRWLLAGALLGLPAVWHPAFLLLLVCVLGARPLQARRQAAVCLLAGAAATLAVGVLASGAWERWSADLHAPLLDAHLVGWNLLWSLIGRHAGGLVYFLPPLLLGLFADLGERFTRSMLLGIGLTLVVLVVLRPFDWLLAPTVLAAPSFLPLAAAGWFIPARRLTAAGLAMLALISLAAIFPLLRAPLAPPVGADGAARYVAPWLGMLPIEASQRELPGVRDAQSGPLRLRLLDSAVTTDAVGALHLHGARAADLLVIAANDVPLLDVEFGAKATPKLEVVGATMGETAFRPDGRVGFELRPDGKALELPLWWSPSRQSIYRLKLRLEGAPAAPIGFTIAPGSVRQKGR